MKPVQRIKVTLCAFNHCDYRWIMLLGKVLDFFYFYKLFHLVGKDFLRSTGRTIGGVLILTVICSDKATNEVRI